MVMYLPIAREPHRAHFCTVMSLKKCIDTAVGHTIPDLDASISSSRCINLGIRRISRTNSHFLSLNADIPKHTLCNEVKQSHYTPWRYMGREEV
jgi:hypothetical protein